MYNTENNVTDVSLLLDITYVNPNEYNLSIHKHAAYVCWDTVA